MLGAQQATEAAVDNGKAEAAEYGNWMPKKFIAVGLVLCAGSALAGVLVPIPWLQVAIWSFSAFCGLLSWQAVYAYHQFSPGGGDVQARIHDFLLSKLPWDGRGACLDVGCGSGAASIKLAKLHPSGRITGVDCWGETYFEYTEQRCTINARVEGVADRVVFQRADAARLPYDDGSFDAIVSNLAFHEVRAPGPDGRFKVLLEALRVLKKGGAFALQDLFKLGVAFGDFERMRQSLADHVAELHWVDSFTTLGLPRPLGSPLLLKGIGVFYGRK
ncbi:MAG: class I SAM-dependent methyltransferase [Candidatus Lokiarchaeota archaeon]|nr:class I SAM-dependent methyltransferase [Candidatus Lokiarchaeota archaeon]